MDCMITAGRGLVMDCMITADLVMDCMITEGRATGDGDIHPWPDIRAGHACYRDSIAQLTIRTTEELLARVRAAAATRGGSMNDFVTRVLDAATDPDLTSDEAGRVREKLARAGLLVAAADPRKRPAPADAAAARTAAAVGTPLSEFVADGRS